MENNTTLKKKKVKVRLLIKEKCSALFTFSLMQCGLRDKYLHWQVAIQDDKNQVHEQAKTGF